jgi:hypothetical protein
VKRVKAAGCKFQGTATRWALRYCTGGQALEDGPSATTPEDRRWKQKQSEIVLKTANRISQIENRVSAGKRIS